jgi:hypothetical protein
VRRDPPDCRWSGWISRCRSELRLSGANLVCLDFRAFQLGRERSGLRVNRTRDQATVPALGQTEDDDLRADGERHCSGERRERRLQ